MVLKIQYSGKELQNGCFFGQKNILYLPSQGEMAEWSNAAVLKTVEGHTSGGSNPSFSAPKTLFSYKILARVFFMDAQFSI